MLFSAFFVSMLDVCFVVSRLFPRVYGALPFSSAGAACVCSSLPCF